jgi:hypothetical protein
VFITGIETDPFVETEQSQTSQQRDADVTSVWSQALHNNVCLGVSTAVSGIATPGRAVFERLCSDTGEHRTDTTGTDIDEQRE